MKPCEDCIEVQGAYGRCQTYYCCSKYIEWQVEVALMQEDDPREEREMDYMIDDREV